MISVIVPMYNAASTLERCVMSILAQSFQNFELLLIDDGSLDNTCAVAQELAKKDHRIRLIKNEHLGVSATRNRGLKEAKGSYIAFIDADDEIKPVYLKTLYDLAEKEHLDWVLCDSEVHKMDGNQDPRKPSFSAQTIFSGDELVRLKQAIFQAEEEDAKNLPNMTMCLYKKTLIDANKLFIDEDVIYGEDLLFNWTYVQHVQRAAYLPEKLYIVYLHGDSSMMGILRKGNLKPVVTLIERVVELTSQVFSTVGSQVLIFCSIQIQTTLFLMSGTLSLKDGYIKLMQEKPLWGTSSARKKLLQTYLSTEQDAPVKKLEYSLPILKNRLTHVFTQLKRARWKQRKSWQWRYFFRWFDRSNKD